MPRDPAVRAGHAAARGLRLCALTLVLSGLAAIAPAAAFAIASLGFSGNPFPAVTTVGDRDLSGTLTLKSNNTFPDGSLTICNAGDGGLCGDSPGITLTPSCGHLSLNAVCTAPDVGVFRVDSPATGSGPSCGGTSFDVTALGDATGTLRLTPTVGHVVLAVPGDYCNVRLTIDVLRFPSRDADTENPFLENLAPGTQTWVRQEATGVSSQGNASFSGPYVNAQTVTARPTVVASASSGVVLDPSTTDSIVLTDEANPTSGDVTFRLFGRNDVECTGSELFSAVVPIHADGTATSPPFTPQAPGSYRWIASYGGDDDNLRASAACSAANESVVTLPQGSTPPPAAPPPSSDFDGDGFPASVDCDDVDRAIHPGAADRPGNRIDEDCSGTAADYPLLDSTVDWLGLRYRSAFVFTRLRIRRVGARSTIRLTCTGAGCPFTNKTRIVKTSARTYDLLALVRHARLRPRARLEVRVSKPNTTGIVRRFTIRGRRGARAAVVVVGLCLTPGAARPAPCPP